MPSSKIAMGPLAPVRWTESGLLDRTQLDGTTLENYQALASGDDMQQAEAKSPSAAPCPTEANDTLAILARILPATTDGMHVLGRPERPTAFLMHLAAIQGFVVDLDSEGRILAIRWAADEVGLASCDFAEKFVRMPLPLLLVRRTSREILISDRAAFLVGNNGITIKNVKGDVEFIAAEELIGLAYRPADKSSKPQ